MQAKLSEMPQIGTGIYSYASAARLLAVSTARVRRWAEGYTYLIGDGERSSAPILQRQLYQPGILTFKDLIELYFVKAFVDEKVPLPKIRYLAIKLSQEFDTPYPFAHERLKADGARLLLKESKTSFIEPVTGQKVFKEIVEPFLKNIEFKKHEASRWFPRGKAAGILVDPQYAFGAPVIAEHYIRTDVLFNSFKVEQNVKSVADWYGVSEKSVEAAVSYEQLCA
jgi:uncharacterized protein (DUF433 family)